MADALSDALADTNAGRAMRNAVETAVAPVVNRVHTQPEMAHEIRRAIDASVARFSRNDPAMTQAFLEGVATATRISTLFRDRRSQSPSPSARSATDYRERSSAPACRLTPPLAYERRRATTRTVRAISTVRGISTVRAIFIVHDYKPQEA